MANTAATTFTPTPVAGVDLDDKSSSLTFPALFTCMGNDGKRHIVATAVGTLGSTANFTVGPIGSATSAASAGVANSYNVNTTGGVVAGQRFFGRSNFF